MAIVNETLNIDTVLFFDEANTTDALGMILLLPPTRAWIRHLVAQSLVGYFQKKSNVHFYHYNSSKKSDKDDDFIDV